MKRLIAADLSRMAKSKLFIFLCALFFALGGAVYALNGYNLRQLGEGYFNMTYNLYLFLPVICSGFAGSVFCAFFIGTDFSDGTVRNKITVGMTKKKIYLANLAVSFTAMALFVLSYILAAAVIGIPCFGLRTFTKAAHLPMSIVGAVLVMLSFSAIYTFISMVTADKARALIVGIVAFAVIMFAGMSVFSRLEASEYRTYNVIGGDGLLQEITEKNPKYLPENKREPFLWADAVLPSGVWLEMSDPEPNDLGLRAVIMQLSLAVITTAAGAMIFERKNVR